MAIPVINAIINFSTGAGFASPMILDAGVLGVNALADTTSVVVDVSDLVDSIKTTRGRSATADLFQTGTLSLRIIDQTGAFNPMNPASPYTGLLTPMRKVVITATYATTTYPIFAGYITSYSTTTPKDVGDVVYTTIQAVDGFRLANNAQITTVTGATAGQTTGTRVGKLLDAIGWPTGQRDIDTGQTTVQADPGTLRNALSALQTIESTEYGALYMDALGNYVFQDRLLTSSSVAGTPVVFNDNGTGISYNNALWKLDDSLVFNKASITRTGGTAQVASNQSSIDKYFLHSYQETNLLMETDADALNNAQAYVASRSETAIRCDAITLDLYTDNYNAGIVAALNLDFFDPVTITTTQPGSSTLTKTLQVFGVSHDIRPSSWKTTLQTLEPIIDSFILNSTLSGVLGTSTLSY
ncbi:hypothetical protein UFOVP1262_8 [uncultured Caudovirales phage]|uniref:Uncharacterized protein n=1 Tax=uncultured Caudovirales phage TaxID=2100421 RepID=A0A6J5RK62_9CAUD|nr:hypothetical protein UFOVP863_11 [uncultured Caudovirales phage]CAB4180244.1 hypothetical protein UFOVP1042_13 [uncultured Caudovirales phage]CAB4194118.1 hypothetical protein UFOVP1262_8 [uncultured Caudovirales phage]